MTQDAAVAFSGTVANLALSLGPAAIPVAAGVQGTVLAELASLDVGAYRLPGDMVARLHKDEMVIPAKPATDFRSMIENMQGGVAGGTSMGDVHLHLAVTAMDGRSVVGAIRDNMHDIAKDLAGHLHLQRSVAQRIVQAGT